MGKSEFKQSELNFIKTAENSLYSLFLAHKVIPNIRYSSRSLLARKISERLSSKLEKEYTASHATFDKFKSYDLIVLDRNDDPLTPLIFNWSYYSMVDEILGIENNSLRQGSFGNESQEIFGRLSGDEFLDHSWGLNFGEAGSALSSKLESEKIGRKGTLEGSSLDELQEIMSRMPETQKKLKDLNKHSEILKHLNKHIQSADLYRVSGIQ